MTNLHKKGGAALITAALLILALMFTACPNNAGGNTGGGGNSGGGGTTIPTLNPDEQWVNDAISKANAAPTLIIGTGKKITLSGDDIKWTSNKPGIINVSDAVSGEYEVTPPEGEAEVILTAKAVKGTFSKEKPFTVIVHKVVSPTLTAADLIKSINVPAETETDLTLPAAVDGTPGATVTWVSDKPAVIGNDGKIKPGAHNLRDIPVKLTATLMYNGTPATKDFTVTLKRITKIEKTETYGTDTVNNTWTFTDSEIVCTRIPTSGSETNTSGYKFLYTDIYTETKTFKAQKIDHMFKGTWYEFGSAEHKAAHMGAGFTEEVYTFYINAFQAPRSYVYEILYDEQNKPKSFQLYPAYDGTKEWFKQSGGYTDGVATYFTLWGSASTVFRYNGENYSGTLNAEGTVFTGQKDSETITVNITDNHDGTLTITVGGNTYTLTFIGFPFQY